MLKYAVCPAAVVLGLAFGAGGGATKATTAGSSSGAASPVTAFDRLPASDFPAIVDRGQPQESGTLTFRISSLGHATTLTASATSVLGGQVGTLSRNGSEFILHFTRLRYRVAPIKLPNGLTVASQIIALSPGAQSTLRIDRKTGAVTSNLHWVVDAPNTLYNGSHTVELPDMGQRRFVSFKRIAPGRYSFGIGSQWHGSVALMRWSVAGKALPGGTVTIAGSWNGHYNLDVKRSAAVEA